jgi:hypothetical protein
MRMRGSFLDWNDMSDVKIDLVVVVVESEGRKAKGE